MSTDIFASLNPAQLEAVRHVEGPLLILAGPGSGKTRVVTHRIAHLLEQDIDPWQILALTFTNKAADEMRQRVAQLAPGQPVWMGTFHRFCARLLRRHAELVGLESNYSIYDTDDSRKLLVATLNDEDIDLSHYTPDQVARGISWAKNELISPEQYEPRHGSPLGAIVARVYPKYEQRLRAANAVDFDNLLFHVAVLLKESAELRAGLDARFRYILVDEYQDTNLAQYAIVRALSIDHPNLAVTGDPDQSIYGWRGANLNNILDFEQDFPQVRVVRLEHNYRSTKNILRVADQLIAHNKRRKQKRLFTDNAEGAKVRLVQYPSQRDEADHIAALIAQQVDRGQRRPRDFAIFYRTNALSRSLEHALRDRGIPYQIVAGFAFYQRAEIKDLIAYLHLINNPRDDVAFLRIINTPTRGIGKKTVERIEAHARRKGMSLLDAARESGLIDDLKKRSAVSVAKFVALYDRLCLNADRPVREVLDKVIEETGYRDQYLYSEAEEDEQRVANIDELLAAAHEFDQQHGDEGGLEQYLEQAALVNDVDDWEGTSDMVTLMTLHAAKGLEFPVVFIVAVEEGQLPHERSRDDPERYEEERRLLFVGITRAQYELQLSYAAYRFRRGAPWPAVASSFLMELPHDALETTETRAAAPVWNDDEFLQDAPTAPAAAPAVAAKIMTAAEMLRGSTAVASRADPAVFQDGMLVMHPSYGTGTIVSVSGNSAKRTATVRFFDSNEEKKFRLAFSSLQPVQAGQ